MFDQSNNTGAIDVKIGGSILEQKSSFKMLGLTFSSKLDRGSYIISTADTAFKKTGALICFMFFPPEVALYLYKFTIRSCMEYCCHVWAGAPNFYLELLDKLRKRISRTVGPHLLPLLNPWVPRPYSQGKSTHYSDRLYGFSVTIPRCYKGVYVNSFIPRIARL